MMKLLNLPWRRRRAGTAAAGETKATMINPGFVALHQTGGASWTAGSYTALAQAGFMRNPVAHRCVRLIAEAAASVPWLLHEDGEEHDTHPMLALLARPNQRQAGTEFLECLYGHLLLAGNAYVEPVRLGAELRELQLLRPDLVAPVLDRDGWIVAFEYRGERSGRRIATGDAAAGGLLHMRLFHPLDDTRGFPPLSAAAMALDLHNQAAVWNKALLDNSARPSGALVYQPKDGGNLTDEQYERLKEELEQGYSGARRAGRPLLLEGGLDWKAMGLTPREMDFVEAKNGAARDIALAFGVPPMLLGIPGDNTYANYQEANRAFYRLTVLPLLARTCTAFTHWLAPAFAERAVLDFDTDAIAGLSAEREADWKRIGAADFLTDDEKRQAVGYGAAAGSERKYAHWQNQPRVPGDGFTLPGEVRISPSALQYARDFQAKIGGISGNWIAGFFWATGQRARMKGKTEWRDFGPGVGLGAYRRREVGEAYIEVIDGVEIAVNIPREVLQQSTERLIDFDEREHSKLVLR